MSKKVVILQSNYIPWKGYFDLINDADVFVYYDEVKYTKNDWRNRNKLYSANGEQWLTIPISKDAVHLKISEVRIEDKSWQELHHKSIYYAYKKAPFFEQIAPLIDDVYLEHTWLSLSELNRYLIETISRLIGIKTVFRDSKDFDLSGERVERLINILNQLDATEYISGPAAKGYLASSEKLFEQNHIKLIYKDYSNYEPYTQMTTPFNHAVSIIDLLANVKLDDVKKHIWEKKQVTLESSDKT
jgi:hypothetical protein